MAEEKKAAAAVPAPPKTAPRKLTALTRNVITVGVVVGINLIFLSLFYYMVLLPSQKKFTDEEAIRKRALELEAKKVREKETAMGAVTETLSVVVNPPSPDQMSFVKGGFLLEYDDRNLELKNEIDKRRPRILNILIKDLSSTPLAELRSPDGKERFCVQLLNKINKIFPESNTIRRVHLVDFVVQEG